MKKLIFNFAKNVLSFSDMAMIKGGYDEAANCGMRCEVPNLNGGGWTQAGCYINGYGYCVCSYVQNSYQCG